MLKVWQFLFKTLDCLGDFLYQRQFKLSWKLFQIDNFQPIIGWKFQVLNEISG